MLPSIPKPAANELAALYRRAQAQAARETRAHRVFGACSVCKREYLLNSDNSVRTHTSNGNPKSPPCPGSHLPPDYTKSLREKVAA